MGAMVRKISIKFKKEFIKIFRAFSTDFLPNYSHGLSTRFKKIKTEIMFQIKD